MALLPSFFMLESGGKYLSVTANNSESSLPSGVLKFDQAEIWSPQVKFAVEAAETGDGALVHIRSCYNNKYLVTEQIGNNTWIVASAKKPEEDRTKASCTLFERHSLLSEKEEEVTKTVRLRHVPTQMFATHSLIPDHQAGCMLDDESSSAAGCGFRAIDSESVIVLPTLISFKTQDQKYLLSRNLDPCWPYQRFEAGCDIGDPRVAKRVFPTANGNYRIKDLYFDKFWRGPCWIWADAGSDNYSNDTVFSVVKLGDNVIALKNLGNNYFCGPLTTEGKTDCLNAHYPSLTSEAMLVIEETVILRRISDVDYRLSDSRIYGEQIIECDHAFATNNGTGEEANLTVNFSIDDSKTSTWSNTVSIKFQGKVEFESEKIPFIGSGKVELSLAVGYEHVWGGANVETFKRESTYTVPVPKSTTMKVTMLCTKASCDVPFSYTQTDLLASGQWVTTFKHDGMFTGINSCNFRFESQVLLKN